jgi:non-specific serine/threonine protein kinase
MSLLGLLPAKSEIAGYTIEEVLGRGATAVVYRATNPSRDERVALKLIASDAHLRGDGRERFEREARLAAAVVHRGILPVYEVGEHEGRSFVAMKLAPGDLAALLREERRLEPARAAELVSQLASALDAAHAHGLLHRDVKPSNVLLDEDEGEERAYLSDFGVARATFADRELYPGELVGTVGYASPEQIRGEPVDRRTDVYALGCLLYECLTGRVPYASRDALGTLWGHLHGEPPQPSLLVPGLPRGLDDVVRSGLAKNPAARFGSAGELGDAACAALERRSPLSKMAAPERIANTNLTAPTSSFIGREEELGQAKLELETTRLLTVTGPGGAGKTRFSIELARRARDLHSSDYGGGVFVCFLAALRDPALVLPTIAQTLSVSEQGDSALGALTAHIAGKRVLLLLDNAEHLPSAGSQLAQLLAACPALTLLVTSREPLHLTGELAYELPPLAPEASVTLFCARAACDPSEPVKDLCGRLEGLPLAIELAAANMSLLPPEELLARLTERLDLLRAGREADPRQGTLRATIEWSYNLLAIEARSLFARLSVFAGGCTREAAEAVCEAELDSLESLVDKSLLRRSGDRYWMLETIREFAADQLEESGEAEERRRLHAAYSATLIARLEPELGRWRHVETINRPESDHLNFVRAIEWALDNDGELAHDLFARLRHVWWERGHEGWVLAERVLASAPACPTLAYAAALHTAACLAMAYRDPAEAVRLDEQALAIYEKLDAGPLRVGMTLAFLGGLYQMSGRPDGRETIERGLAFLQAAGDEYGVTNATGNLGNFALQDGDFAAAARLSADAAARAHAHGFELQEATSTCNQALALVLLADPRADEIAVAALRLGAESRMSFWIGLSLLPVAAVAAAADPRRAALLVGAADAELEGAQLGQAEQAVYEQAATTVREALGATLFEQLRKEGRGLGRDAAVQLGLGSGDSRT